MFRAYDDEMLDAQHAGRRDASKSIQTSEAAALQLPELFESDPAGKPVRVPGHRVRAD